jgi:transcription antitermination factor NusG
MLVLKLADNPPILAPGAQRIADLCGRWWLGHTKARAEKAFAFDLMGRGIGHFLPMVERVRMSGGRKRHAMMPLFPSYVFFCGDETTRYHAMTTDRLCQVIPIIDQPKIIEQLSHLELALAGKAQLDPYPFAVVGERCRVVSGPFQGIEGVVIQRTTVARLVLQVGILGQGAAMEIDAGLLEPVWES